MPPQYSFQYFGATRQALQNYQHLSDTFIGFGSVDGISYQNGVQNPNFGGYPKSNQLFPFQNFMKIHKHIFQN